MFVGLIPKICESINQPSVASKKYECNIPMPMTGPFLMADFSDELPEFATATGIKAQARRTIATTVRIDQR